MSEYLERYRVYHMLRRRDFVFRSRQPQKRKSVQFVPRHDTLLPSPISLMPLNSFIGDRSSRGGAYDRFYYRRFSWRMITKDHYGQIVRRVFGGDVRWG